MDAFDQLMESIYPEWRYHWCGGDPRTRTEDYGCACLGCVNNCGGVPNAMYERWLQWVDAHPQPPATSRIAVVWDDEIEQTPRGLDPSRLPK